MAGVGPVNLPLRAPLAKKLISVARPATFGRGRETLSDTAVRDTWEIVPEQFTIGGPTWPTLLCDALEHLRDDLGLPAATRLRAEPHAMLVYGKGQFFLPHQDSEKDLTGTAGARQAEILWAGPARSRLRRVICGKSRDCCPGGLRSLCRRVGGDPSRMA